MPILWDSRRGKIGKNVDVTSIEINGSSSVNEGATITLNAVVKPDNTTQSKAVTWTSSDESIATVANGVVTAKSAGKTTITVCSVANPSICASKDVTVVAKTYTYEILDDGDSLSVQWNVKIWEGNKDITSTVAGVFGSSQTDLLGSYSKSFGYIRIKKGTESRIKQIAIGDKYYPVQPK